MSGRLLTVVVVAMIFAATPQLCHAQTLDKSKRQTVEERTNLDRELDVKIKFCRQLMLDQNWAGAADMLEVLYESRPDNMVVVSLLIQCYESLRLYEKSEEVIGRYLDRNPDNFNFHLLYAEVLAKQGQLDKATQQYVKIAKDIPSNNPAMYQVIVQSMVTHGLDDTSLGFIDSLRLVTGDSVLFALQRGTVLERQKAYADAAREFYSLLSDTASSGNNAETKLLALLSFVESAPQVESFLLNQSDLFHQPRALKLLSSHYLRSGQYDKALQFTISQDSLEGFSGRSLENLMRSCFEHRLYEQVVRTGEYMFGSNRAKSSRDDVYFIYGEGLVRLGRLAEAIDVFSEIHDVTKQRRVKADALYRIGKVYLDNLNRYNDALTYFDSVMAFYGDSPAYLRAMVSRPLCYIRQGLLVEAEAALQRNLSRSLEGEFREQSLFDLARVQFFLKEIDSSKNTMNRLLAEMPRGMSVNDVVRLLYTLQQAQGNSQLLYDYSNARIFIERRMEDSARAALILIAEAEDSSLADVALFELAQLCLSNSDTLGAVEFIDRLVNNYPESYFLPYGLKIKADFYSSTVDKQSEAQLIYRRLLENHPNFPLISEVRQKMRQLQEAPGVS